MRKGNSVFDFVSFFCGLGASDLGLIRAGGRCLLAVDLDPEDVILRGHERNLPGVPTRRMDLMDMAVGAPLTRAFRLHLRDMGANAPTTSSMKAAIRAVHDLLRSAGIKDPRNVGKRRKFVFIVTAPCQGFCDAVQAPLDPRNPLVLLAGTLSMACPFAWILVENTSSILGRDNADDCLANGAILEELFARVRKGRRIKLDAEELKQYVFEGRDCGLAQRRSRLVVPIPPLGRKMPPPLRPNKKHRMLGEVIGPGSGFRDPDPEARILNDKERCIYRLLRRNETFADALERLGRKAPPQLVRFAANGRNSRIRRLAWNNNNWTIVSALRNRAFGRISLVHPTQLRFLSIGECREVQGVPRDWILYGNIDQRYLQVGNIFPPIMAELAAQAYVLGRYPKGRKGGTRR